MSAALAGRLVTVVVTGPIGYVRHEVNEDLPVELPAVAADGVGVTYGGGPARRRGDPYRLSTIDVCVGDGEVWLFFRRQTRGRYRRDFLDGTGLHVRLADVRRFAGLAELADRIEATVHPPGGNSTEQLTKTPRPGGTSLVSLRRVGSPNTHDRSGEIPMVTTNDPDCVALGCDWDWDLEECRCGRRHTFRVCARCLTSDNTDAELCAARVVAS